MSTKSIDNVLNRYYNIYIQNILCCIKAEAIAINEKVTDSGFNQKEFDKKLDYIQKQLSILSNCLKEKNHPDWMALELTHEEYLECKRKAFQTVLPGLFIVISGTAGTILAIILAVVIHS